MSAIPTKKSASWMHKPFKSDGHSPTDAFSYRVSYKFTHTSEVTYTACQCRLCEPHHLGNLPRMQAAVEPRHLPTPRDSHSWQTRCRHTAYSSGCEAGVRHQKNAGSSPGMAHTRGHLALPLAWPPPHGDGTSCISASGCLRFQGAGHMPGARAAPHGR